MARPAVHNGVTSSNVRDLMSPPDATVGPDTTVAEAATVMGTHRVGSVLVLDEGLLAGIFTERDVVRAVSRDSGAMSEPVAHWMTPGPQTVAPDETTDEALRRMLDGHFRHLPVMEAGRLVGMLSMRDLARLYGDQPHRASD